MTIDENGSWLKCYYDQIIDIHLFYIFVYNMTFLHILPNFNPFRSFFTFISENLRPPLLDLVPRLGCELEKMTSYAQKYLTGWNYNNNKYRKSNKEQQKFWTCSLCNFLYLLLLQFQPMRYFCAYDIIFSNSQPSLGTRSSNGGRKFLKIKVKIEWLPYVRNGLKFGKICKKVILYTKM